MAVKMLVRLEECLRQVVVVNMTANLQMCGDLRVPYRVHDISRVGLVQEDVHIERRIAFGILTCPNGQLQRKDTVCKIKVAGTFDKQMPSACVTRVAVIHSSRSLSARTEKSRKTLDLNIVDAGVTESCRPYYYSSPLQSVTVRTAV
jgi:hypothetical protein